MFDQRGRQRHDGELDVSRQSTGILEKKRNIPRSPALIGHAVACPLPHVMGGVFARPQASVTGQRYLMC